MRVELWSFVWSETRLLRKEDVVAMRLCEGNACEHAALVKAGANWIVQNTHAAEAIRVEFEGVLGGTSIGMDLEPGEERTLPFHEFFGTWHANFIKRTYSA